MILHLFLHSGELGLHFTFDFFWRVEISYIRVGLLISVDGIVTSFRVLLDLKQSAASRAERTVFTPLARRGNDLDPMLRAHVCAEEGGIGL